MLLFGRCLYLVRTPSDVGYRHLFWLPYWDVSCSGYPSYLLPTLDSLEWDTFCASMLQRRRDILVDTDRRFGSERHRALMERLVRSPRGGNAWHADHVTAVYQVWCGVVRRDVFDRTGKDMTGQDRTMLEICRQDNARDMPTRTLLSCQIYVLSAEQCRVYDF